MLKVTELRGRLRVLGLPTRGRKSELVARLRKDWLRFEAMVDKTQTTLLRTMQENVWKKRNLQKLRNMLQRTRTVEDRKRTRSE